MHDTEQEYEDARTKAKEYCEQEKITFTHMFVPWSSIEEHPLTYDGKPWRCLNWSVTVYLNGRAIITTPYSAGIAKCPAYQASTVNLGGRNSLLRHDTITQELETGKAWDTGKPINPDYIDVLALLVWEYKYNVINFPTYEQWAPEAGYDIDSRRGEKLYQQCLTNALKMRAGLGEDRMAVLREMFKDF